jgi:hypothetical protein
MGSLSFLFYQNSKPKRNKKNTCIYLEYVLSYKGCGMIALKREVAAHKVRQVFRGANVKLGNWRQVTVPIKETAMLERRISVEFS